MLGVLTEEGLPTREMGILEAPAFGKSSGTEAKVMQGGLCTECGNYTVIKKDGASFVRLVGRWGRAVDELFPSGIYRSMNYAKGNL